MTVISINEVKLQRQLDEKQLLALDGQIRQVEDLMVYLLHLRLEIVNRLGLNKSDGPGAA